MDSTRHPELQTAARRARPWWLSPAPLIFAAIVVLACAAVLLQPGPKPVDPRTNIVLPGNASFCDTAESPTMTPPDSTPVPPPQK